ncbi:hypothetical protein BRADI_1g78703v3 [Brachypodium distachyon]|uniref:Major facilitator superfamily (MFS) profile domain-containing protein n=1 Tax=Brachypodium distachyon TaxID=15368 RepID=A0A2K2DVU0_BRADI|nr:hypothetical protein BRADI_1g78703v3 [Brachypodium distachyon]
MEEIAADAREQVGHQGEETTRDGSVDWNGMRCVRAKSGGWFAGFLILLNQALATLAVSGIGTNLVTFMRVVMRQDNADAANHVSNWSGTTYVFSIIGALIADSYWGRYKACIIFQLLFLAGMVELSIASYFFLHKYSCDSGSGEGMKNNCSLPSKAETVIFYVSIYQIALGNGAYQPAITTFGADQFDEEDTGERESKNAFYGYFFLANNLGSLLSVTLLTYIEDQGKWTTAFAISTLAAFLGLALFAVGTLRFRHFLTSENPVVTVSQVVVAAIKNRHLNTPKQAEELYEVHGTDSSNGGRKILHTPDYRCLDKAAVMREPSTQPPSKPLSLCTVTQVEQVKCILRLVPIWLCSIIYSTAYSQMTSVFVEQARAMDNTISKFRIPPAGVSIFEIVGITAFVFIYRFCIAKPLSKRSREPSELERMGIGLIISAAAMVTAGMVERQRLKHAGSLSVLWQIPQYLLMGASEVFMYVTMTEFFNDQLPDGMRSLGSALAVASMSAGSYASSLIVTLVMAISCRGGDGSHGWIPEDLNKGHVDRFFFLIAVLDAVDLVAFVVLAKRYRQVKPATSVDLK